MVGQLEGTVAEGLTDLAAIEELNILQQRPNRQLYGDVEVVSFERKRMEFVDECVDLVVRERTAEGAPTRRLSSRR